MNLYIIIYIRTAWGKIIIIIMHVKKTLNGCNNNYYGNDMYMYNFAESNSVSSYYNVIRISWHCMAYSLAVGEFACPWHYTKATETILPPSQGCMIPHLTSCMHTWLCKIQLPIALHTTPISQFICYLSFILSRGNWHVNHACMLLYTRKSKVPYGFYER